MDDFMVRYDEQIIIKAEKEALKRAPKIVEGESVPSVLPKEGEGNKYAGFF